MTTMELLALVRERDALRGRLGVIEDLLAEVERQASTDKHQGLRDHMFPPSANGPNPPKMVEPQRPAVEATAPRYIVCAACAGTGVDNMNHHVPCRTCGGERVLIAKSQPPQLPAPPPDPEDDIDRPDPPFAAPIDDEAEFIANAKREAQQAEFAERRKAELAEAGRNGRRVRQNDSGSGLVMGPGSGGKPGEYFGGGG